METKNKIILFSAFIFMILLSSAVIKSISSSNALSKYNYDTLENFNISGNLSLYITSVEFPYFDVVSGGLVLNVSALPLGNITNNYYPTNVTTYNITKNVTVTNNITNDYTHNFYYTYNNNITYYIKNNSMYIRNSSGKYLNVKGTSWRNVSFNETELNLTISNKLVPYFTKLTYWSNLTTTLGSYITKLNYWSNATAAFYQKGLTYTKTEAISKFTNITLFNSNHTFWDFQKTRIDTVNDSLIRETNNINSTLNNLKYPQNAISYNDTYETMLQEYIQTYQYDNMVSGTTKNIQGTVTAGLDYNTMRISTGLVIGNTGASFPFSRTNNTWYQVTAQYFTLNNSLFKTGFYIYDATGRRNMTFTSGLFSSNFTNTVPIKLSVRDGCVLWYNKTKSSFFYFKTCIGGTCIEQQTTVPVIASTNTMTTYYTYELKSNYNYCYNTIISRNRTNTVSYSYNFTSNIYKGYVVQAGTWWRGLYTTNPSINFDYVYYSTKRQRMRR